MGRYVFKLPDVGEGTTEAEIVAWRVKVGDTVKQEQELVDVMTDKATVEMTSPVAGRIVALHGETGRKSARRRAAVELEVEGAGNAAGNEEPVPAAKPAPAAEKKEPIPAAPVEPAASEKPLASPAVRERAPDARHRSQIRARQRPGRAHHARRSRRFRHRRGLAAQRRAGWRRRGEGDRAAPQDREKMQESKRRIPHYTYVEEIDMTELEAPARATERGAARGPAQAHRAAVPDPGVGVRACRLPADQRALTTTKRAWFALSGCPCRHRHANRERPARAGRAQCRRPRSLGHRCGNRPPRRRRPRQQGHEGRIVGLPPSPLPAWACWAG